MLGRGCEMPEFQNMNKRVGRRNGDWGCSHCLKKFFGLAWRGAQFDVIKRNDLGEKKILVKNNKKLGRSELQNKS